MKKLIENLVKVANYLDTESMFEESNTITNIAVKLAQSVEESDVEDIDADHDMIPDDEDLDNLDEDDMDEDDMDEDDMDEEDDDYDDNMKDLTNLLDELGVSEDEKLEIIEMIKKDTSDVEEFAYEAPTPEDEDMATDDMFAKSDQMAEQNMIVDDMNDEEEQAAADNAMISDNNYDDDIRSILQDDPELLAWYESLGKQEE
jgi:hypothetical protein